MTLLLPGDLSLPVGKLAALFNNTTNAYKYLFFHALLKAIKSRIQNNAADEKWLIPFEEIFVDFVQLAWYPHRYFRLSFGVQDRVAQLVDQYLKDVTRDSLEEKLKEKIQGNRKIVDVFIRELGRYVTTRLIRPFFAEATKGCPDWDIDVRIYKLSRDPNLVDQCKPLYVLPSENQIQFNTDWLGYFRQNMALIEGWANWHWIKYMQSRNPRMPSIADKLFPPEKRKNLIRQRQYWNTIIAAKSGGFTCIYTGHILKNQFDLDHFIPWSYFPNDEIWNLIPAMPETNRQKSDSLPIEDYIEPYVRMQWNALCLARGLKKDSRETWHQWAWRSFASYLDASDLVQADFMVKFQDKLKNDIKSAETLGFPGGWRWHPM